MIHSYDDQVNRRQRDKINEKVEDLKHYQENLIPQLEQLKEQNLQKEQEKMMKIKKYKEDLDRQCQENKKIKYGAYNTNAN